VPVILLERGDIFSHCIDSGRSGILCNVWRVLRTTVSRRIQNKTLALHHVVLGIHRGNARVEPHLLSEKMDIHCSVNCATARK